MFLFHRVVFILPSTRDYHQILQCEHDLLCDKTVCFCRVYKNSTIKNISQVIVYRENWCNHGQDRPIFPVLRDRETGLKGKNVSFFFFWLLGLLWGGSESPASCPGMWCKSEVTIERANTNEYITFWKHSLSRSCRQCSTVDAKLLLSLWWWITLVAYRSNEASFLSICICLTRFKSIKQISADSHRPKTGANSVRILQVLKPFWWRCFSTLSNVTICWLI